jgi:hypothetical protein
LGNSVFADNSVKMTGDFIKRGNLNSENHRESVIGSCSRDWDHTWNTGNLQQITRSPGTGLEQILLQFSDGINLAGTLISDLDDYEIINICGSSHLSVVLCYSSSANLSRWILVAECLITLKLLLVCIVEPS